MALEFKLPELGENIESGTVVNVLVSEGDTIEKEQAVIELETEKAVVEVPSEVAGKITKILVKSGDEVQVGQTIMKVESSGGSTDSGDDSEDEKTDKNDSAQQPQEDESGEEQDSQEPKKEDEPSDSQSADEDMDESDGEPSLVTVKLPDLGENIEQGTVVNVLVSAGDSLEKDQSILELETEKAVVEVPSDVVGTVKEVKVKSGQDVKVGQTIITVESKSGKPKKDSKPERTEHQKKESTPNKEQKESSTEPTPTEPSKDVATAERPKDYKPAAAAPSVRRFAREIGVDINEVKGTGPNDRISIDDVKAHSKKRHAEHSTGQTSTISGMESAPLPDFGKWGEVERQKMSKVRATTAVHLTRSWTPVPHVTQFDKADITDLEKLRKQYSPRAEEKGGKITMTSILLKVVSAALKVFPQFNASVDMQNKEIIYKKYFNIGVAVDTDAGLLVPVVKDVDQKNLIDLSVELTEIAKKARDRKLSLEEMQGGNFTISNLGGIGGTAFTPIVNSPEVAILGVSRGSYEPVYKDGEFVPRMMLPLSLSYDHRLIDGADAARFARWVVQAIEEPFTIILEG